MAESRHLCPRRDLSVDAGLSPAQFQVRPIPQHYQHYLATPRMHHFPRNSSSTQMVSEGLYQETRCLLGARGPEACGSLCPAPCVPFPGPAPYVLPPVSCSQAGQLLPSPPSFYFHSGSRGKKRKPLDQRPTLLAEPCGAPEGGKGRHERAGPVGKGLRAKSGEGGLSTLYDLI